MKQIKIKDGFFVGKSEGTKATYLAILENFFSDKLNYHDVEDKEKCLARFDEYTKGLKPATINLRLKVIRSYVAYLQASKIVESNPFHSISNVRGSSETQHITFEEMLKLRASGDEYDQVIITILGDMGIRISERYDLNPDILSTKDRITIIGKGNKERTIPIPESVKKLDPKVVALALQLTDQQIRRDLLALGKKIGMSNSLTPHMFRRWYATNLYNHGVDLKKIQVVMGHDSITTLVRYIESNNEGAIQDVLGALNGNLDLLDNKMLKHENDQLKQKIKLLIRQLQEKQNES